ncbi:MAG: pyridoxal phosphate-dependent aminotransferase [Archaeoglobaceae archaeon]
MMSRRVEAIQPSATLKISEEAKKLAGEGKPVVNMSVGEPDFPTPQHIVDAAVKALHEGHTYYTPGKGVPELVEAIGEKLKENRIDAGPENIITTPGAKYAIFESILATINRDDEVILLDPSWVSYEPCILMANGMPVWVPHTSDFQDAPIEDYITDKTKMIILNSPSNPLGVVYPKEFLKKVRDIAVDHHLLVMSDEIYEKIIFDGEHISIASFEGMEDRTIVINGFSKSYAMTGWRLGYAVAPPWVIKSMAKIQSHSVSHATSFAQYGGIAALKGDQQCVKDMVQEFKARRDLLMEGLDGIGAEYAPPRGAFYMFVNVGFDSVQFSEELLQKEYVATTPGSAFGKKSSHWIRLSYATSKENLQTFLERYKRFIS